MGAAKGAVDVDESGLRLHSLAQGDAVSAPGSTGAGAACGGLATTSGDRERLEDERPESVLLDSRSRPESGCSRPELERTESVLLDGTLMFVLYDSPPDHDELLEQLLDGGPGGSVGRPSADDAESLSSKPVEYLLDRQPYERAESEYSLLTGRAGGSVASASVRVAGCWPGSFDTFTCVCTTFSTSRGGPFFKPLRFARRSARRLARRLARRCSRSAR